MKKFRVKLEIELVIVADNKAGAAYQARRIGKTYYDDLAYVGDVHETFERVFDPKVEDKVPYVNPVSLDVLAAPEF